MRIYLCDDEIKILNDFKEKVSRFISDSEVRTFSSGKELLEKMERPCYDFVRETEAFCGIQESLKAYAQKWQVKE